LSAQAGAALSAIPEGPARQQAADRWSVQQGLVLQAQVQRLAGAGLLNLARADADRMASLAAHTSAPDASAPLLALQSRAAQWTGQPPAASRQPFGAALAQVDKLAGPVAQAAALREMGASAGPAERGDLRNAVLRVASRAEAAAPAQRAEALKDLALMWAEAGQPEDFAQWRARALQTPGLLGDAATRVRAELVVGHELAQAVAWHRAGDYALTELPLRRVAGYLM
jgi:hypothetical protein